MSFLVERLGGGSGLWTFVCLCAILCLGVAGFVRWRQMRREEHELRERLAAYRHAEHSD